MEMFNSIKFIKSLKEGFDAIPVKQGDQAAKVLVSDAIKAGKFNPEEVFSFICKMMGNPSVQLDEADWKNIIKRAIKRGGLVGKCLEICADVRKGSKVSPEDLFYAVVTRCGENPDLLKSELYLNKVGWLKVADTLVKSAPAKKVETKVKTKKAAKTKAEKKVVVKKEKKTSSIKTQRKDPRCKPVTLIKDGVKKTWTSFRDCEKELGVAHGTISQVVSREVKQAKGWILWEEEKKSPVKHQKLSKGKAVRQYGRDKNGRKVNKVWASLTAAAKGTGIPHSSISKAISGTYQTAGGYQWKEVAEAAA